MLLSNPIHYLYKISNENEYFTHWFFFKVSNLASSVRGTNRTINVSYIPTDLRTT